MSFLKSSYVHVHTFPIASDSVANPHRLKDHVALSLHGDVSEVGERELDEAKLKEIPDKSSQSGGVLDRSRSQRMRKLTKPTETKQNQHQVPMPTVQRKKTKANTFKETKT